MWYHVRVHQSYIAQPLTCSCTGVYDKIW